MYPGNRRNKMNSSKSEPWRRLECVGRSLEDLALVNRFRKRKRGVVDNIRGAKESMISKPKDFAHGLFKNKKYGSADNIHSIKLDESQGSTDEGEKRSHHGSGIIPPKHHTLPTNLTAPRFTEFASEEDAASDVTSESAVSGTQSSPHATLPMSVTTTQLETLRIAQYAEHLARELEEQKELTVNLQTVIHDLKDLASMEEKMEYKLEERTLDLQELLESCQTRVIFHRVGKDQVRILSTIAVIAGIVATWQHWYSVRDFGHYYYDRYSHIVPFL
ncbi:hypothetical protein LSH36_45g16051 [Paralvinella palmiformis]|uniref:Uncharacterized protein n=1 Tax=Paralvinella palmiformis TaxID=53620 RepID=A0AAD9NDC1_9ANNE|nr:hypothetical protein LSH36_45g16051 [Paralvinella palmiformis]